MLSLHANAPLVILSLSPEGILLDAVGSTQRVLGVPETALLGCSLVALPVQTEEDRRVLWTLLEACQQARAASGMVGLQWAEQPPVYVLLELCPGAGHDGGALWAMRAPPEAFEERLRSARQDAQRELIINLSHNLNNILTGILAPAQLLLEVIPDPDAQQDLRDILAATTRARNLLRELYQTVKIDAAPAEPLLLKPILTQVSAQGRVLRLPSGEGLGVDLQLPREDLAVLAHPESLLAILVRTLHNAHEAQPRSGRVTLRVLTTEGDVLLEILDDGEGMDEEIQRRAFEPLFSTKSGVGSGLSLATARAQLRHWGGDMSLRSAPRQGTRVQVRLRRATLAPTPPASQGRLLIVEDDLLIARAMQRLFSRDHAVTVAHSGPAILEGFQRDQYDVALVDLTMPEMSGDLVAQNLRQRDPHISLLLLTGWLIQPNDPLMAVFDGLLQKPVTDLARARERVQQAIHTARARRHTGPAHP